MAPLISYLLQASGCMILFYAAYYFLLRRLTFFTSNRIYLLLSLAISIVIPVINLQVGIEEKSTLKNFIPYWRIEDAGNAILGASNTSNLSFITLLPILYFTGVILMAIKLGMNLVTIFKVYNKKAYKSCGTIRIVKGTEQINNCSFLDTVFLNPELLHTDEYEQVIKHEECHIRRHHTYDKLFIHLIQVFFWFNPFIYLYRRSIEEVNEFEADALLARQTDKRKYANLLLRIAINNQFHLLNCFSRQSLKARVQMLFNRKSNKLRSFSYFIMLPLILIAIMSFSIKGVIGLSQSDIKSSLKNNSSFTPKQEIPHNTSIPEKKKKGINEKKQANALKFSIETNNSTSNKEITNYPTPVSKNEVIEPLTNKIINGENVTAEKPFFTRKTIKDNEGNEFDEVRIHFGKSNLVGVLMKGGKLLYLIEGIKYEEDDLQKISADEIEKLSCPCKVQIRDKNNPLILGSYDGIVEIIGKK